MPTIERSIEVDVPLAVAYRQWTQFEEFPRFMAGVVEVRRVDETLVHWVAEAHGRRHEWDVRIVEQRPERVIGWRALDGTRNGGRVTFLAENGHTRVSVLLVFEDTGEGGSFDVLGPDEERVEKDLERFKALVEHRRPATPDWRGAIEPARLVEDDGTVL